MGQAAIKATRRDIRRAVGAEALTAISEHEGGIHWCVQQINALRTDVAAHEREFRVLLKSHQGLSINVHALRVELERYEARLSTFLGRLRWLFLGR